MAISEVSSLARRRNAMQTWGQFARGILYLSLVSLAVTVLVNNPLGYEIALGRFSWVFLPVSCHGLVASGLALTWLTVWVVHKDSRLGQFGVGSFLFFTLFTAMFFAAVRWLAVQFAATEGGASGESPPIVAVTAIVFLVAAIPGVSFLANSSDRLVKIAVWTVQRPHIPPLTRTVRRRPEGRARPNIPSIEL